MRSGLRPIHSVDTITWTSEISGTASSGVRVIAQVPHTVRMTVPVNTRYRLAAHPSMMRSIMTVRSVARRLSGLLRRQDECLLPDGFAALLHADGDVPFARHHHVARPHVH